MTRARIQIDYSAGAAYIDFGAEARGVNSTVEVSPTINVDLDRFGIVVGVELLSLSLSSLPLHELRTFCHFRDDELALIEDNVQKILELLAGGNAQSARQGVAAHVDGFQFA